MLGTNRGTLVWAAGGHTRAGAGSRSGFPKRASLSLVHLRGQVAEGDDGRHGLVTKL